MLLLLASEHDDINVVGDNEKIFYYGNEFVRIKINQKSLFCVFKTSHSHRSYPCYICINGIFITSFLIFNCLLSFIWKLIDHKF